MEIEKYQLTKLVPDDRIFDNFENATKKACEIIKCPTSDK
jgi:hypothetical protein